MNKELNLSGLTKAQKIAFLKNVAENSNFKPFVRHIEEKYILQESTELYVSSETGKTMTLQQLRNFEDEYHFVVELVDKTVPVDPADPSQGLQPCEIWLGPYTIETYLLNSQRNNSENEK